MDFLTAAIGAVIGAMFGWSLAGWVQRRNDQRVERFHAHLDELRRQRNGGGQ